MACYELRPKSGTWTTGPDAPRDRLRRFDLTVTHDGKPLGGNNIQAVLGAPDERRDGLDADVILWLKSGWWVTLRGEFARAPDIAHRILASAAEKLSDITADPRGAEASILGSTVVEASRPDHWF
jgi:hypothetical protein